MPTTQKQLQDLINPHTVIPYDSAWTAFAEIDKYLNHYPCDSNMTYIPDVYSSYCWTTDKQVPGGECGNYKMEGDCFNREHVWPKSWFGGFDYGCNAESDLFELWPTDGYVNGLRGNLPLGYVDASKPLQYVSSNGCIIGKCQAMSSDSQNDDYSYAGDCFEVADEYKGDFARAYFYLATAYWNVWNCCDDVGVNGSDIKPWMESELRQWHVIDPVDDNERQRNDIIYENYQHNRNPFIDYPELVDQIHDF